MKRRFTTVAAVIAAFLAIGGTALADQASGTGQTPLDAALGFNAQQDLSGSLNYVADPNGPNAGFRAHCNDFTKVVFWTDPQGNPKVRLRATCTDQDGKTIYMRSVMVDYGEPGTNDWLCIRWDYANPLRNPYILDRGVIKRGNIQIQIDSSGGSTVEMLGS